MFTIWYGFSKSIVTYVYVWGFVISDRILLQGIAYSENFQF